jgi:hypothetical protein
MMLFFDFGVLATKVSWPGGFFCCEPRAGCHQCADAAKPKEPLRARTLNIFYCGCGTVKAMQRRTR